MKSQIKPNDNLEIGAVKLDANQISTWFYNNSLINRDPLTSAAGFEWPAGSGMRARYSGGIWMGCVVNSDTLTSMQYYGPSDFTNGYIDDYGVSQGMNDSNYRIYKIYKGDTLSNDYLNWPVNQGAYTNELGKPYFLGTQTMFYVFNDNYIRNSNQSSDSSMKAQLLQINWAYNIPGYLENVIFTEYRIINRSKNIWNNFYFGIWNDDDTEAFQFGKVACDTLRNLGYNYYTYLSSQYGSNPPAIGNLFLRGLLKYTGNFNDSVSYYSPPGSNNLVSLNGYENTGLSICNRFNNSSYPPGPTYNIETYRVISGHHRDGSEWINPTNNNPTTFVNSGDPVTNSGWIQEYNAYKRTFQGSGPIDVNPGDTVSVLYAQLIARGSSNLNSIVKLRETADYVQQIYDENFQSVVSVNNSMIETPDQYYLSQNYPNPFNPATVIKYTIPTGVKNKSSKVTLIVYDNLGKKVATLVSESKPSGNYEVKFKAGGLSSGIYFYKLEAGDFIEVKKMMLIR